MQSAARAQEAEEGVERFVRNMARTAVIDSSRRFLRSTLAAQKTQVAQKSARDFITRVRLVMLASRESMKLRICSVQMLRHGCLAVRKLHAVTLTEDDRFEWTMIANVEVKFVLNGALGCGVACGMFISCCKCEPMATAQSLGDDTRAVATRPPWPREHGPRT